MRALLRRDIGNITLFADSQGLDMTCPIFTVGIQFQGLTLSFTSGSSR